LLKEALAKIAKWKNETDPDRLKWSSFVKTQESKVDVNFVKKISKLKEDANEFFDKKKRGEIVLDELIGIYMDTVTQLDNAWKALKDADEAVKREDPPTAIKYQGVAAGHLKAASPGVTKAGLKKLAVKTARVRGAQLKYVSLTNRELDRLFKECVAKYKKAEDGVEALDPIIGELTEALAAKEPETTSTNREYQEHLKELVRLWKTVVDFAKEGLGRTKKLSQDIGTLEGVLARTEAGTARALVLGVERVYDGMNKEYREVDTHIHETIRNDKSIYYKQATDWGITSDDRNKSRGPLTLRAFALNAQARAVYVKGTDKLVDILEELVKKFDNAEAKAALDRLEA
jgi:hypothetical protein